MPTDYFVPPKKGFGIPLARWLRQWPAPTADSAAGRRQCKSATRGGRATGREKQRRPPPALWCWLVLGHNLARQTRVMTRRSAVHIVLHDHRLEAWRGKATAKGVYFAPLMDIDPAQVRRPTPSIRARPRTWPRCCWFMHRLPGKKVLEIGAGCGVNWRLSGRRNLRSTAGPWSPEGEGFEEALLRGGADADRRQRPRSRETAAGRHRRGAPLFADASFDIVYSWVHRPRTCERPARALQRGAVRAAGPEARCRSSAPITCPISTAIMRRCIRRSSPMDSSAGGSSMCAAKTRPLPPPSAPK